MGISTSKAVFAGVAAMAILASMPAIAQATDPALQQASESARLQALFRQSDEASLKRNPIMALFRGDRRYADQFGDYLSEEAAAAEKATLEAELRTLATIDRSKLSAQEQISHDVFRFRHESALQAFQPQLLAVRRQLPLDHFTGLHERAPDMFSGNSIAPFTSVKDYEDNLKRLDGLADYMDQARELMREGRAAGIVQPRIVSERLLGQLDRFIAAGVDDSILMMPLRNFPETVPESERARLRQAYAGKIGNEVLPSYVRMRDFVRDRYLPSSRGNERPGLVSLPGGRAYYALLVKDHTTTDLTPEQIHQTGLDEVARITAEMERVMKQVGFKGDLKSFFPFVKSDARFKPASKEALTEGYYEIGKRVDAAIPTLFSLVPRTPLEIRPVPEYLEKDQAGAYYFPGTPDGKRPGLFYFNTYDLPSRLTLGMETLYLHEAVPGHHFQIALATENESLPEFQRFGNLTAFAEGWGLYAESLGQQLGLFRDPYQYFGRLNDEMMRAMRLVVDTGLHAKGWSRQRAIDYMLANSSMGETDATNEVDRYIAMPGQALAYKVGQLRISAARARAEAALGPRFDIRDFHAQVLGSGSLPLPILDNKIDAWVERVKAGN